MRKILLLSALVTASNSFCQVVSNVDWVRNYSERDQLENVPSAIDANNNVFITGYTVFGGTRDFTTIKYDASGTQQWVQHYNNIAGGDDRSNAVVVDATGNIYVTGQSQGTSTGFDYATIKYNSSGVQQWVARYDGTGSGDDIAVAIAVDNSGNVYVTGRSKGTSSSMDYATVKYNSSGVQQWVARYNGTGNADDGAVGIALGTGNRVYVTGTARMTGTGNDVVTIRYNANNGNQMWVASTNGTSNGSDAGFALLADGNDVVVCGMVHNSTTNEDYFLYKFNGNNGAVQIQKSYDGYNSSDYATGLVKDSQGNYVLTGVSRNISSMEYHTVKFNSSGIQQWVNKRVLNQSFSQVSPKIAVDFVDHFYVCGEVNISNNIDMLLYQITPGGNTTWTETHNGTQNGNDVAVDLVMGNLGVIYLAGQTQNSNAKFDYTTIKYSQTPVYFPIDYSNEPNDKTTLFFENSGQIITTTGQSASQIKYYTNSHSPSIYFGSKDVSFVFSKIDTIQNNTDSVHRVDLKFLDANPNAKPYHFEMGEVYLNYYLGHVPNGVTGINGYERIMIPNIYANIDLHYYTNSSGIKYYFVIKPGGNPAMITHFFEGATSTGINGSQLEINTILGNLVFSQPTAYQINPGLQVIPLGSSSWQQQSVNTFKFNLPSYNSNLPLIIMVDRPAQAATPTNGNVCWSTYLGGSNEETIYGITTDPSGNFYATGQTFSSDFPVPNGFQQITGGGNAFYTKFNSHFDLLHSTYLSGTGDQAAAYDIVTNSNDEIILVGRTLANFQDFPWFTHSGAYIDSTLNGGGALAKYDGFIAKFDPTGQQRVWVTYYGGNDYDEIFDVVIDANDNLFVVGYSNNDAAFPQYAPLGEFNIPNGGGRDGFIAKFDQNDALKWSTYYGGAGSDAFNSIDIDGTDLFVNGYSKSSDFPTLNPTDGSLGGTSDNVIVRFNTSGIRQFATYIGGSGDEKSVTEGLNSISANSQYYYVVGKTNSNDLLPVNPGGSGILFDNTFSGNIYGDGYLAQFSRTGNTLVWETYISEIGATNLTSIFTDNDNNVFIAGSTADSLLMLVQYSNLYFQDTLSGRMFNFVNDVDEGILIYINPSRQVKWSTFIGGFNSSVQQGDALRDIELSGNDLFVAGLTSSQNNTSNHEYPLADFDAGSTLDWYDNTYNGGTQDGIITKFCIEAILGVEEESQSLQSGETILVYPNPSSDFVTLISNEYFDNETNLSVYGVDGKLIYTQKLSQGTRQVLIPVNDYADGIYFVHISDRINSYNVKFVKE
jgi:hypothetical protein